MDWSAMLHAEIVVFGCGNTLLGDDGLAPRAVSLLAAEYPFYPEQIPTGAPIPTVPTESPIPTFPPAQSRVAFVDAGTSIRPLLLDMLLLELCPRLIVVVDVVQEQGREPGSLCLSAPRVPILESAAPADAPGVSPLRAQGDAPFRTQDDTHLRAQGDAPLRTQGDTPRLTGSSALHQAPTWALLHRLQEQIQDFAPPHAASPKVLVLTVQAAHIPECMDDRLSPEAQAALPHLCQKIRQLCSLSPEEPV